MSQDAAPEITDTPIDREAMRAIGASYDLELDIDYETESDARLNALWLDVIAPWLASIPDAAFAAFGAAVDQHFETHRSNIASFARERAAALLLLITDWRWVTWANEESLAGRNPYQPAA